VAPLHYEVDAQAYPPGGLDVFVRMQRDAQVRACLTTKRLAVLSEGVEVHPADSSPAAVRAADVVRDQLAGIPGGAAGGSAPTGRGWGTRSARALSARW
jgi:hypothetical protein